MQKYTDEDIRNMNKITCKIAADYLGLSPMAVSIGMRNNLLPIGFAIHNEERDRTYSESWSYHIMNKDIYPPFEMGVSDFGTRWSIAPRRRHCRIICWMLSVVSSRWK